MLLQNCTFSYSCWHLHRIVSRAAGITGAGESGRESRAQHDSLAEHAVKEQNATTTAKKKAASTVHCTHHNLNKNVGCGRLSRKTSENRSPGGAGICDYGLVAATGNLDIWSNSVTVRTRA